MKKPLNRKERLSPQLRVNEHTIASAENALAKLRRVQGNDNKGSDSQSGGTAGENADKS